MAVNRDALDVAAFKICSNLFIFILGFQKMLVKPFEQQTPDPKLLPSFLA